MEGIVGIRFTEAGPLTWCSADDLEPALGDYVVVNLGQGEQLGWVVVTPDQTLAAEPEGPLRVIERLASGEDVDAWRENRERALEDLRGAQELATRNDPRVRVASLTYNLAGTHCRITFSAPERIQHRWFTGMCRDLLGVEVEVRQVGDRDRAKALGDVGVCGLALCCRTWQTTFPAISMRMAKEQDLPPNPTKISGVCGRLLCCLSYEVDEYRRLRGTLPKVGKRVTTPVGRARVIGHNTLKGQVRMRLDDGGEVIEMTEEELSSQYGSAVRPEELEAQVEEPVRRQAQRRSEGLLATLEAVDAPADGPAEGERTAEQRPARAEGEGDKPARRRRRGRRGGRRRRRGSGGGGGQGGSGGSGGGGLN